MIRQFTFAISDHAPFDMAFDLEPATCMTDYALHRHFEHGQIPELEVVHLMVKVVRPGDTVIDGGANVGFFTILLSKLVGPSGEVIAVEPSERNRKKLLANIALNKCENVTVRPEALSFNNDPLRFYEKPDNGEDGCFGEGEHRTVPAVTLDEIAADKVVRLVKLDIEGFEANALRGAGSLLQQKTLPFLVCETNSTISGVTVSISVVVRRANPNFDLFILSESGTIPALVPNTCILSPQRMNSNLLFSTLDDVVEAWHEVKY